MRAAGGPGKNRGQQIRLTMLMVTTATTTKCTRGRGRGIEKLEEGIISIPATDYSRSLTSNDECPKNGEFQLA